MQIITSGNTRLAVATLTGIFVSVMTLSLFISKDSAAADTEVEQERQAVYLSTSTIPVHVSGVVKAAKSTVVYAETAGVVTSLPVREGATVVKGEILAVQATPVADARLALASAERGLSNLNQSLNNQLRSGQAIQAAYRAYSASEIASLRAVGNDDRVQEGAGALSTSLEQSVLTITTAANYVNNNRSLFSAEGLQIYDEVVSGLYGEMPDYFRGGVAPTGVSSDDLKTMLDEVKGKNDPAALKTLALITNGQLTALTKLFATGESDVFDRNSTQVTESMQAEYLTQRIAVLSAAQSLQSVSAAFSQIVDGVLEDGVAQQTNVNVSDLDRELALTQASYAEAIRAQADVVAAAGEGVVAGPRRGGAHRGQV